MGKTYSRREVEQALVSKGFVVDPNDHRYLHLMLQGRKSHIKTMVSHGRGGKDIPIGLLGKMAGQCALKLRDFRDLVDCPLGAEAYAERVRNHKALHSPPWPQGTRLP